MEVSFAHANPTAGNESFVIRFSEPSHQQTPCLLVDAGSGVDVDALLGEDDYLLGILLTHAHSDHYCSLSANLRDGANVYAAPSTACVLETVLTEGSRHQNLGDTSAIIDALVPISEWKSLLDSVRVRPIPAGHCPGAAGFIIQFKEGDDWRTMVATGDFTLSRAGGYPAFPKDMMLDVEAVFLTGATSTRDDRKEMLRTVVEHATAGARTLLTATGLAGVEFAYLLGHLIERDQSSSITVTVVGHLAKLYTELGYDVPNVEIVPEFESMKPLLNPGGITIAGPQVPTEGASGRLFGAVRNDPNAAVIQMTDGGATPLDKGGCTLRAFEYIPHPTEAEVDSVVEALAPAEVVITHQTGANADRYKDRYASYVWATDEDSWHQVFDGVWQSPPWMTDTGRGLIRQKAQHSHLQNAVLGELPLPSLQRHTDVDFPAEGVHFESPERLLQPAVVAAANTMAETATPDSPSSSETRSTLGASSDEADAESTTAVGTVALQEESADISDPARAVVRAVESENGETVLRIVDMEDDIQSLELGEEFPIEMPRSRRSE